MTLKDQNWKKKPIQVFWGEVAPSHHLLQLYENEDIFLTTIEGFVACGFRLNDSVIILGTKEHLMALDKRPTKQGFDLDALINQQINADEALGNFMVSDWPDSVLFCNYISQIIHTAKGMGRKVRAFGELVAVLWEKGLSSATVQLEHLWEHYIHEEKLSLFCALPKSGFTQDPHRSLQSICACHSLVISGEKKPATEIYYRSALHVV